ncbi:MAG: TAXI family TRAP transporter solute-binding subunit [Alphaproteobacteria bacterium]|nr:TAXI family TRAP transporter solute-binding subunit [Alphaproteobacteria bacterium]
MRFTIGILALGLLAAATAATAQELRFFRIGTGDPSSSAFVVGTAIAAAISSPPGAPDCAAGGSCGVKGLVAVATSTAGSIANVDAVAEGRLDSAFIQADVLTWAAEGVEIYKGRARGEELRAIAGLFPEYLHVVARNDADIRSIADLKGKRVAVDTAGSGTLITANRILRSFNVSERSLAALKLAPGPAADMLAEGEIDALFVLGAAPVPLVDGLTDRVGIGLVPVEGRSIERLRRQHPFLSPAVIPEGTYEGLGAVPTIGVASVWVVSARADAELVYQITRSLWHPVNRKIMSARPGPTSLVRLENALATVILPLHPGAQRYYREINLQP